MRRLWQKYRTLRQIGYHSKHYNLHSAVAYLEWFDLCGTALRLQLSIHRRCKPVLQDHHGRILSPRHRPYLVQYVCTGCLQCLTWEGIWHLLLRCFKHVDTGCLHRHIIALWARKDLLATAQSGWWVNWDFGSVLVWLQRYPFRSDHVGQSDGQQIPQRLRMSDSEDHSALLLSRLVANDRSQCILGGPSERHFRRTDCQVCWFLPGAPLATAIMASVGGGKRFWLNLALAYSFGLLLCHERDRERLHVQTDEVRTALL